METILQHHEAYFGTLPAVVKHPQGSIMYGVDKRVLIAKGDQFTDNLLTDRQSIHMCIVIKHKHKLLYYTQIPLWHHRHIGYGV